MIPERGPQTAFPTQSMGWNVWGATYGTQPTYGVQPLGGPHSEPQTSTTDAGTAQGHSLARDTARLQIVWNNRIVAPWSGHPGLGTLATTRNPGITGLGTLA